MINTVNIFFFFAFVCTTTYGCHIFEKSDHAIIDRDDNLWYLKLSCPVNRPSFPAYIRFYNEHTAKSEYELDCSTSYQVLYYNAAPQAHIIWRTTDHLWTVGDSYYVTLDEGVLYSNNVENSTERHNPKFWTFKVIRPHHG